MINVCCRKFRLILLLKVFKRADDYAKNGSSVADTEHIMDENIELTEEENADKINKILAVMQELK